MTVVITDTRTLVDHADGTTGWSSPVAGETITIFTSDPDPVELSGCLGIAVSEQVSEILHTFTAVNLSSVMIYVWVLANGTMETLANGGIAMIVGDGVDTIAYRIAGSDVASFRHNDNVPGWQCMLMDTTILPGFDVARGVEANLDFTNATELGAQFETLSKALGGSENCFIDTIRYGNDGLVIAGGATGARGNFNEIAIADRSAVDGTAYGICHEVASSVFGLQGPLTFGLTVSNAEHWFQDTNVTVVFEDRNVGTSRYFFDVVGNSTDTQHFQLGLISGSSGGSNGCSIIVPASVGASMTMNDADLDFVGLYDTVFTGFDGGVLFCDDATNGIAHDVFACTFTLCGQINPGRVDMRNCSINLSPDTSAFLLDDTDNTLLQGLSFQSDGTGHAIEITATGSYTFTNFTYAGYGAATTTDATVFNDSGGAVTITISGGDIPTIRNGSGASTTVVSTVSVNIHVEDSLGVDIQDAQVSVHRAAKVAETSGAGNTAQDPDLVITGTIPGDQPATGYITVLDRSTELTQGYRYASHDGSSTFTLPSEVTFACTGGSSGATVLEDTVNNFVTLNMEEGDTIRNDTDGSWAIIDEITGTDDIITTPLTGGSDNTWTSGDFYSVHQLATTLISGVDIIDMFLSNGQADSNGDAPTLTYDSAEAPTAVTIRVRFNSGATKYIPFKTSGTISASDGLTLNVVLQEDTVAT